MIMVQMTVKFVFRNVIHVPMEHNVKLVKDLKVKFFQGFYLQIVHVLMDIMTMDQMIVKLVLIPAKPALKERNA